MLAGTTPCTSERGHGKGATAIGWNTVLILRASWVAYTRFDRSLRRRKTSGIEGEAEVDAAYTKRRD